MSNFYQILGRSKKSIARDLRYSEYDAQLLYGLLRDYWKQHEEASNSEAFEYFQDWFERESEDIATFPSIRTNNIKYYVCKYLVEHPNELRVSYDKIIREEKRDGAKKGEPSSYTYSSNILSSIRQLTIEGLVVLRKAQSQLDPEQVRIVRDYMSRSKKEQRVLRGKFCDSAQKRVLDSYLDYLEGDEFTQLYKFLQAQSKLMYTDLKSNFVESILRVTEKMDEFGLLEQYTQKHLAYMRRIGLSGLAYEYDTDEAGSTSVKSFFTKKNVEKLDIYQLGMLNAFLINRYTKELQKLNKTFFIVSELGLWSQIKSATPAPNGRISIDIDEKELEALYRKMNFLEVALGDLMEECQADRESGEEHNITTENGTVRTFVKMQVSDRIDDMECDIGDLYREYFGRILPESSNYFGRDFDNYRVLQNAIMNTYRIKDYNMITALFNAYQVKCLSKNWGFIPEDRSVVDSSKILLGFDIEGFNMPIKLHIDKSLVLDFLRANQGDTKIPIYEGDSDYTVLGQRLGTQILMPLFMKQKKALKMYEETVQDYNRPLIEHTKFLKDSGKYPDHLKVDKVEKKGKNTRIIRVRPPRKFIDLETGEQFIEEKDGSLKSKKELEQKSHESRT